MNYNIASLLIEEKKKYNASNNSKSLYWKTKQKHFDKQRDAINRECNKSFFSIFRSKIQVTSKLVSVHKSERIN